VWALERERGRLEGCLEFTEQTESTLREERDRLIAELEAERAERRRLAESVLRLNSGEGSGPDSLAEAREHDFHLALQFSGHQMFTIASPFGTLKSSMRVGHESWSPGCWQ
jgi:hypothetical protein